MLYRLKKDIEPKHNIVFFDSEIEEVVEGVYVDEGVIGEVVDQGKTNNKRHLAFWFDENKSINFSSFSGVGNLSLLITSKVSETKPYLMEVPPTSNAKTFIYLLMIILNNDYLL